MVKHSTFKDAYWSFWRKTLDFSSRSTRKEYWFPMVTNLIIYLSLITLGGYLDHFFGIEADFKFSISNIFDQLFGTIFSIGVLSVTVRRFHDLNLPGAIAVIPGVAAIVIIIISLILDQFGINTSLLMSILLPIIIIILAVVFLVFLAKDGTHGENNYVEDPLNR